MSRSDIQSGKKASVRSKTFEHLAVVRQGGRLQQRSSGDPFGTCGESSPPLQPEQHACQDEIFHRTSQSPIIAVLGRSGSASMLDRVKCPLAS